MERGRCCLVVGADHLGANSRFEETFGAEKIMHWNGRGKHPNNLPNKVQVIIIFTGFVSHNVMWEIKRMAKSKGIRMVFLNRGLSGYISMRGGGSRENTDKVDLNVTERAGN